MRRASYCRSWLGLVLVPVLELLLVARPAVAERPHVYVVVLDGLGSTLATRERVPVLFGDGALRIEGRAVMPTRTNPNHASLMSGVYPGAHGVTGNGYWSRNPDDGPAPLEGAGLLDVETLFTVAERERPALVTMAVFSKPKLRLLFSASGERQKAPDVNWSPQPGSEGTDAEGYARDTAVLDALLALTETREPDLAFVNLGDVDRTAHARGPEHADAAAAVGRAGTAVERIIESLRARGRWQRSVVIVTADHGFDAVGPTADRPQPTVDPQVALAGMSPAAGMAVADGGVAHLYAAGVSPDAAGYDAPAKATLEGAAAAATKVPGVAAVYTRLPLDGVAPLPADWHLEHERVGDLLLIAADGYQFLGFAHGGGGALPGNHGGPSEIPVPVVVFGGHEAVARIDRSRGATAADVGATVAALLGLRDVRRVDGTPVPEPFRGRSLVR
jgi:hypothetical protein